MPTSGGHFLASRATLDKSPYLSFEFDRFPVTHIGLPSSRQTVNLSNGRSIEISWAGVTDTGHRRAVNEDSLITSAPLFAVADGMGGHAAGDYASSAVVTRLSVFEQRSSVSNIEIEAALSAAVEDILGGAGITELGSGTTVTGAAIAEIEDQAGWLVFNIGDSRVYRSVAGSLQQLTTDHSIVQQLIDIGSITEEEAETHPHANIVTRAVGAQDQPVPDYRLVPVEVGMRLLLCSDGLTKELTAHGIQHFLTENPSSESAARALVDAALGNGGRDNVTVVVIDVHDIS